MKKKSYHIELGCKNLETLDSVIKKYNVTSYTKIGALLFTVNKLMNEKETYAIYGYYIRNVNKIEK